jgi:hypothetical protein
MEEIMFRFLITVVLAGGALSGVPAHAQDPSGPSDSARYTFYRAGDTFLRLDVRSGRVSDCAWVSSAWISSGWFCRAVPDERAALESEIYRLLTSNMALKKELLARGLALPDGIKPDPSVYVGNKNEVKQSSEAEPDRAVGYVEKVWRRLVEMMSNLQRDMLRKS